LPPVRLLLISVTKLWDLIIRLFRCKGRTADAKALETKSACKMAIMFGFFLQLKVK
jgi:hypothetical protein